MTCIEIVINTITNSCFMRLPPFLFYTFIIPFFTLTKANIVKLIIKFEIRKTSTRSLGVDYGELR